MSTIVLLYGLTALKVAKGLLISHHSQYSYVKFTMQVKISILFHFFGISGQYVYRKLIHTQIGT